MRPSEISAQLALFDKGPKEARTRHSSTFAENLSLPIHRWFRYSAGFSALWVNDLIQCASQADLRVLDPFAGSGTVLLEAEACGVQSIGVEAHPFIARVASAKLLWRASPDEVMARGIGLINSARGLAPALDAFPPLIRKCFPDSALLSLAAIHQAWSDLSCSHEIKELLWLALIAILRQCSPVGTANWQYVLPKKSKSKVLDPYDAYRSKVRQIASDMAVRQALPITGSAKLYREDARDLNEVADGWANLVITSPPYPNNFDYADATRLEQSFLGEVTGWGDLQGAVRQYLIRSCSQHVQSAAREAAGILSDPLLSPIAAELTPVYEQLECARESHGGKKAYHVMVAAYFLDMAKVWRSLRRATAKSATVCFVIGDSAPYGIYVPVERWMGELALSCGFTSWRFEKTRDRNIKWKNRKHRVPLHEGRLCVEG